MLRASQFLSVVALLFLLAVACAPAKPAFPDKPITVVVPFAAGGIQDLLGRKLADLVKSTLGQPVSVVNRAGGSGVVGTVEVLQSKPDGYNLVQASTATMAITPHVAETPYKGPADYTPLIKIANVPFVFAVKSDAPWKTMKEALDYAKANPKKLRVGNAGTGSTPHLLLEVLKDRAGVDMTHVPFSGSGEAIPALLGGHVEALVLPGTDIISHVRAGTAKILGDFEEKRNPAYQDVPTMKELGYDITRGTYHFVIAPKGTPDDVAKILHDAYKKAMDTDDYKKFAADSLLTTDYKTGADLAKELDGDYVFFADLVKKLNLNTN